MKTNVLSASIFILSLLGFIPSASASLLRTGVCGSLVTGQINLFDPQFGTDCIDVDVDNTGIPEFTTDHLPTNDVTTVDVLSESFKFSFTPNLRLGSPIFTFTGLNWIQGDGKIVNATATNVMGFDNSDLTNTLNMGLSNTGNSITLDLTGTLLLVDDLNNGMFTIELDVMHTSTPEPTTILGLLAFGGVSLLSSRKRVK